MGKLTHTVSGSVASFQSADKVNAEQIIVSVNYVQSGSGDPYPPGGSNNLIPDGTDTTNGYISGKYLKNTNATTSSTACYVSEYFPVLPNEAYVMSTIRSTVPTNPAVCFYDSNKTYISGSGVNFNGISPVYITTPADAAYARCSQYYANDSTVQFELGSTATTIMPYSNIRPITGWDRCTITCTTKNIFNISTSTTGYYISETGVFTSNESYSYSALIPVNVGETYVLSGHNSYSSSSNKRVHGYDANGLWVQQIAFAYPSGNSDYSVSATIPSGVKYIRISYREDDLNVQVERGSTKTAYEAYNSNVYQIIFPNEAGTVYGGTLTVNSDGSGTLVRDWFGVVCQGTGGKDSWSSTFSGNSKVFRMSWSDGKPTAYATGTSTSSRQYCKSSHFTAAGITSSSTSVGFIAYNNYVQFRPKNVSSVTVDDWKTFVNKQYLNGTPLTVCYRIREPVTYTLTASQVSILLGHNNISADTGNIEVEYPFYDRLFGMKKSFPN